MRYKLLALDLDDTLLGKDATVSPANQAAIKAAMAAGLKVVIATGRMYRSARRIALQLGLNLPLITYHGALIRTVEGETIHHCPIPNSVARELAAFFDSQGLHVNLYIDDNLYARQKNDFTRYYENLAKVEVNAVGRLEDFLAGIKTDPTKMTVIHWNDDYIPALWQQLQALRSRDGELFTAGLNFVQSRPYFLEATSKLADKAYALEFLGHRYNIDREEIVAAGDSYNDLGMIKFAGLGVAVENARPEVKEAADYIAPASDADGVAFLIEQLLAGKV